MTNLRNAFAGQSQNEPVFIFVRGYPVAFLPTALIIFILVLFCTALYSALFMLGQGLPDIVFNAAAAGIGIFSLMTVVFGLVIWIDFYFDVDIVTDRRVVDIEQNRLFDRQTSELNLEDIEDVSVTISGPLSTLFNYGNVLIQTAGTHNNFHFENVAHPRELAAIISDLAEQVKNGTPEPQRFPTTGCVGVVNNQLINSRDDLIRIGAYHLQSPRTTETPPNPPYIRRDSNE